MTLDVIGKSVFNYDFNSLTTASPVIQVGGSSCRGRAGRRVERGIPALPSGQYLPLQLPQGQGGSLPLAASPPHPSVLASSTGFPPLPARGPVPPPPAAQAIYTALKETETRATDLLPYWKVRKCSLLC